MNSNESMRSGFVLGLCADASSVGSAAACSIGAALSLIAPARFLIAATSRQLNVAAALLVASRVRLFVPANWRID